MEKEIRMDTALLKEKLKSIRCTFGPAPLTDKEMFEWSRMLTTLETDVKSLNVKINNYNLLVPLLEKQLVNFQLEREAGKILENGVTRSDTAERVKDLKEKTATYHSTTNDGSILDVFFKIFR